MSRETPRPPIRRTCVAKRNLTWQNPLLRRVLIGLGVTLFFAGFVWVWWHWVPVLYEGYNGITQAERLAAITNTRAALLAGLVGVGALGTFWLNSRVYRVTARTFDVTERGHVTDRYSKAIEQLGSESIAMRLGGIYALEQLAAETDKARDRATVVQVISAFARVHSDPIHQYREHNGTAPAVEETNMDPDELRRRADLFVRSMNRTPEDVQAALTVLGRLPSDSDARGPDLSGACLRRAKLSRGNCDRANFRDADLTGAWFYDSKVGHSNLRNANLTEAELGGANLECANFYKANLTRARLVMLDQYGEMMTVGSPSSPMPFLILLISPTPL